MVAASSESYFVRSLSVGKLLDHDMGMKMQYRGSALVGQAVTHSKSHVPT